MTVTTPTPARTGDPDTSHAAAISVNRGTARAIHQWVIEQLTAFSEGLTHEQLWDRYESVAPPLLRSSQSGLRTRVSELVRGGVVRDSGRRAPMRTGRQAIVWELCDLALF